MSEEKKEEQKQEQDKEAAFAHVLGCGCSIFFGIVIAFWMFGGCSSCISSYDDTWDRLDHSVKTDSYYRQWD